MISSLKEDWVFKGFKFRNITKPQYRHVFLVLFWPFYTVVFFILENRAVGIFHEVHCQLDDIIPFAEGFIMFYVLWYPFWIFLLAYGCFFEVPVFTKTMKYFIITFCISLSIYFLYPTGHHMWPNPMPRNNIFTWLTQRIYDADHPTNICPSDHVIGAFAVVFGASESKRLRKKWPMTIITTIAIMITLSICFVKQHSALDILVAAPIVTFGYIMAFWLPKRKEKKNKLINDGAMKDIIESAEAEEEELISEKKVG